MAIGRTVNKYLDELETQLDPSTSPVLDKQIKEVFHRIWSSQVGTSGYNKKDWRELQELLEERGIKV